MMRAAIALLAVGLSTLPTAAVAGADDAAPHPVRIGLAPPVGQDLTLTISDDRLMRDGGRVAFHSRSTLRFDAEGDGWVISLRLDALDCDGAAAACAAFRQILSPALGQIRRYSLSPALALNVEEAGPLADGSTVIGNHVLLAVAAVDAEAGPVSTAELREALRLCNSETDAVAVDGGLVMVRETERITGADGATVAMRDTESRIDPASGLTIGAVTEIRSTDAEPSLVSRRRWQIEPSAVRRPQ